jgi:hypothetical protein
MHNTNPGALIHIFAAGGGGGGEGVTTFQLLAENFLISHRRRRRVAYKLSKHATQHTTFQFFQSKRVHPPLQELET